MKTSNAGIDAVLAGTARFAADLYSFYFNPSAPTHWTGADTDLTYSGTTWLATGPILLRGSGRSTAGLEVDSVEIRIAPGTRTLGTQTLKVAAMTGAFDNVRVLIKRAYMSTWGTVPGVITVFDGNVLECEPTSSEIRLVVKSALAKLGAELPPRILQPQCPYMVYDSQCGVTKATWTHDRTAASGSTAKVVKLSSTSTNANVGGFIEFTTGDLDGVKRTIQSVSGVDVTLSVALPAAPATGVHLDVTKGCEKTRTACRAFSNIAHFGGFPDTPKPAATITAADLAGWGS